MCFILQPNTAISFNNDITIPEYKETQLDPLHGKSY